MVLAQRTSVKARLVAMAIAMVAKGKILQVLRFVQILNVIANQMEEELVHRIPF